MLWCAESCDWAAGRATTQFVIRTAFDSLCIWRCRIEFKHQGKSYGEQELKLIIIRAKSMPTIKTISQSYVLHEGNAEPFYERMGFRETGKVTDGEIAMVLNLL